MIFCSLFIRFYRWRVFHGRIAGFLLAEEKLEEIEIRKSIVVVEAVGLWKSRFFLACWDISLPQGGCGKNVEMWNCKQQQKKWKFCGVENIQMWKKSWKIQVRAWEKWKYEVV